MNLLPSKLQLIIGSWYFVYYYYSMISELVSRRNCFITIVIIINHYYYVLATRRNCFMTIIIIKRSHRCITPWTLNGGWSGDIVGISYTRCVSTRTLNGLEEYLIFSPQSDNGLIPFSFVINYSLTTFSTMAKLILPYRRFIILDAINQLRQLLIPVFWTQSIN